MCKQKGELHVNEIQLAKKLMRLVALAINEKKKKDQV
jgi:hypothetical protein